MKGWRHTEVKHADERGALTKPEGVNTRPRQADYAKTMPQQSHTPAE